MVKYMNVILFISSEAHKMYLAVYYCIGLFYLVQYTLACPELCKCNTRYHRVTCSNVRLTEEYIQTIQLPPGTTALKLGNTGLKRIYSDLFYNISNISTLEISKNHIPTLPANTFIHLKRLKKLTLKHNKIRVINQNSFNGLSNLEDLSLEGNLISSLSPGVFEKLSSIKTLKLSKNRLQELPNGVFIELKTMQSLYLDGNNISRIGDEAFQNMSMRKLGLSSNRLERLPPSSFKNFKILFKILLYFNPLDCRCEGLMTYLYYYQHLKNNILGASCSRPAHLVTQNVLTAYKNTDCSLCSLNLCRNQGVCYGNHTTMWCDCKHKFAGEFCEHNVCQPGYTPTYPRTPTPTTVSIISFIKPTSKPEIPYIPKREAEVPREREIIVKTIYVNRTVTKDVLVHIKDKAEGRTVAILYLTCAIEFLIIFCLVVILVWRKCDDWKMEKRYNTNTYTKKYQNYFPDTTNGQYVMPHRASNVF